MKIRGNEIKLKITPKAIAKAENNSNLDIFKILRKVEGKEEGEIKASDYCELIYAGYLGATNEEIKYENFLQLLEDEKIDILKISHIGTELICEIYERKN